MRGSARIALFLIGLVVAPAVSYGQGSIAGIVKDASGAVLPGVTVEAASPALIEKVRAVVTDSGGQYQVVDLRPGLYTLTFTLPGFNVAKREGIELTGSFAATVNVDLRVGAVEETITVSAEAPTVDTQNARQQRVLPKDVLDAIPSGRTPYTTIVLIPGVSAIRDVGGTTNLTLFGSSSIHGGNGSDMRVMVDGTSIGNSEGSGAQSNQLPDMGSTQEVNVDYAGGTADQPYAGLRINIIPREGGNDFKGSFFGTYANDKFQGDNVTDDLKARGLGAPNSLQRVYDFNPSAGGRLVRDRLWVFGGARWVENNSFVAGRYYNLNEGNPDKWTYEPDVTRQAFDRVTQRAANGRVTWQASARNKFSVYYDDQFRCWCNYSGGFAVQPSPEAMSRLEWPDNRLATVAWSSPLTSRLLLEARYSDRLETYAYPDKQPDGSKNFQLIQVTDQAVGLTYRSMGMVSNDNRPFQTTRQAMKQAVVNLSYVTGSHAVKVGFSDLAIARESSGGDLAPYSFSYRFNNALPNQITQFALPYIQIENQRAELGLYAQDKWTINKLTLNLGVRYDWWNSYYPEQHLGPGPLVPTRDLTFPQTEAFSYKDITPRIGAAYDLYGNGKTALRASLGRYTNAAGIGQNSPTELGNPALRLARSVTRTWTDANGNFAADCDLLILQEQDRRASGGDFCGTVNNLNFGRPTPSTTLDPRILSGWGIRPDQWEFSASVQQELAPRVSVNAGYFRRLFGNFLVTDNTLVTPSDYSPFSVTAPADPRLPGGGGYVVTGLYDLNQDKVGQVDNRITFASDFGNQIQHWNGVDLTIDARLRQGVVLQGGVSTGRTSTDRCELAAKVDNPSPLYCHQDTKFLTQVKFLAVYMVPRIAVQVAATYQSIPGPGITANYNAPNAVVSPSLGRNLSGGAPNTTVNLVEPGTMFGEQSNQLDFRVGKVFRLNRLRTLLNFDFYNALNGNSVLTQNNAFAAWQVPLSILSARLFKFSLQVDF